MLIIHGRWCSSCTNVTLSTYCMSMTLRWSPMVDVRMRYAPSNHPEHPVPPTLATVGIPYIPSPPLSLFSFFRSLHQTHLRLRIRFRFIPVLNFYSTSYTVNHVVSRSRIQTNILYLIFDHWNLFCEYCSLMIFFKTWVVLIIHNLHKNFA